MVQLIVGAKGKGKTKVLLDSVNSAIKEASGSIVYLDKSSKHMYELSNKVRLIDLSIFPVRNNDEFIGFICGIISQDHDLEKMYLDSFLKLARIQDEPGLIERTVRKLDEISTQFNVDFILSVSMDKEMLPEGLKDMVSTAL
ncbi:MAG: twitching motility protein PilT [Eubacterium sp.]|nr:twitching motility protein PilT [Eubacterium sp.]MBR3276599.1 twitching motility protein PilT [Eubacterium sp.]